MYLMIKFGNLGELDDDIAIFHNISDTCNNI